MGGDCMRTGGTGALAEGLIVAVTGLLSPMKSSKPVKPRLTVEPGGGEIKGKLLFGVWEAPALGGGSKEGGVGEGGAGQRLPFEAEASLSKLRVRL